VQPKSTGLPTGSARRILPGAQTTPTGIRKKSSVRSKNLRPTAIAAQPDVGAFGLHLALHRPRCPCRRIVDALALG